jgi:hypothetical protein
MRVVILWIHLHLIEHKTVLANSTRLLLWEDLFSRYSPFGRLFQKMALDNGRPCADCPAPILTNPALPQQRPMLTDPSSERPARHAPSTSWLNG